MTKHIFPIPLLNIHILRKIDTHTYFSSTYTISSLKAKLDTMTAITTTTTTTQAERTTTPRLAIKTRHLAGLDPEWVELWNNYGANMVRADELSLEDYRKDPAKYSFTYPTCAG